MTEMPTGTADASNVFIYLLCDFTGVESGYNDIWHPKLLILTITKIQAVRVVAINLVNARKTKSDKY